MAKLPMLCPFNEKMCEECQLYRGRHYYLCTNEHYRGYIKSRKKVKRDTNVKQVNIETIKRLFEPWSVRNSNPGGTSNMRLKVVDLEHGTTAFYTLEEAKKWNWDDPRIMRTIFGGHVASYKKLSEIVNFQEEKGVKEITIVEAPLFMLA
jgi:hypothetical protein